MIRHKFAGAAIALVLLASPYAATPSFVGPAAAQAPVAVSPSHLQAAREMLIASGIAGSFDSIYLEFRDQVPRTVGGTRPELMKDMAEVIAGLKPEADRKRDDILASASEILAKKMTEADLKEVSGFFNSPVGLRYNAARTQALDEIFVVLQPWSTATSNFLFDRFSAEMKKRGHQL